jgi:aminodeoxyfutalosine deaminase
MIIQADSILTMKGEPIAHGAVRIENGKISQVGLASEITPAPGEEVVYLENAVLCPGLINAHCHLDYTELRGSMDPPEKFTDWIKNINALKREFTAEDFLRGVEKGFKLLVESGTTAVANIESYPELLSRINPPPIRTWWFLELIDVRNKNYEEEELAGALAFFEQHPDWLGGFGLSPHAPYTASIPLYRLARRCSEQYQMPFTTHIAESVDEQEMFANARGDLYELMQSLGRDCTDCGHGSPLSHLLEHGVLTRNCLAVHLNYLHDSDFAALAECGAHVVHCPKSHVYFGHRQFELMKLRALGINICIGTDSLASNNTLDLRAEIREAAVTFREVSPREWLEMITLNPARALNQSGQLGEITPGAQADLVAFRLDGHADPYEAVIGSRERPQLLMVQGKKVIGPEKADPQIE